MVIKINVPKIPTLIIWKIEGLVMHYLWMHEKKSIFGQPKSINIQFNIFFHGKKQNEKMRLVFQDNLSFCIKIISSFGQINQLHEASCSRHFKVIWVWKNLKIWSKQNCVCWTKSLKTLFFLVRTKAVLGLSPPWPSGPQLDVL